MSNSWFQFKQFMVQQNRSAMKVTTDACLFGAWVAAKMATQQITRILDIGAGTGLLSLMMAQKIPAHIDAVEIDEAASDQATENVAESPFRNLIAVNHCNIMQFRNEAEYDLIVSNPPFFERSLRSPVTEINLARHEAELTIDRLFKAAATRLASNGYFALLLPCSRFSEATETAARYGLQPKYVCKVRQSEKHDFFRVMIIFSQTGFVISAELTIKKEGQYSHEFEELLRDYYLHL